MRKAPFLAQAAFVAAALAVGTAACGSPGSLAATGVKGNSPTAVATATADPLAGLTGKQIAQRAAAGTAAAPGVRWGGTILDSGTTLTFHLTVLHGKGCEGTVSLGPKGSVKLFYDGTHVWMLPDAKFYQAEGIASAESVIGNRYLEMKADDPKDPGLADVSKLCTINTILAPLVSSIPSAEGVRTTIDGQPVIKVTVTSDGSTGYVYVTDSPHPELLRIAAPGAGEVSFTYTGLPQSITPPPASDTFDASQLGI